MTLHPLLARLVILGGSSLLTSCQDPTTGITQVEGKVVADPNGQPVGGAFVQVYHASTGGGYVPVGTSYPTDAQGRFSFQFDAASKAGYLVKATAPPGYFTDWAVAPSLTAGRKNMGLVIPMLAPAWVRIQLVDEPPKSRATVHTQGYEGPGDTFYYPRDTTVIRPLFAGFKSALLWSVYDQGQEKITTLYIQPAALDTVTIRISF
jgi:hypothetical protein